MLDRVDWFELEDLQKIETVNKMNKDFSVTIDHQFPGMKFNPETTRVMQAELPFYEGGYLMEICDEAANDLRGPLWFVCIEERMLFLNGSSAPIHDMNETAAILLTQETVVDYVHFFCFFVHGDEGPFLVLEDVEFPAIDQEKNDAASLKLIQESCRTMELTEVRANGFFIVKGTILYGNALFDADFAVTEDGMIEMIDDGPIAVDIHVRKVKPNY